MLHLYAERLAALADEAPTPEELEHLELCRECSDELEVYRRLLAHAAVESAGPGAGEAPLTDWASLSARLRREGMLPGTEVLAFPGEGRRPVRQGTRSRVVVGAVGSWGLWVGRLAAAVVLLASGLVLGRATANAEVTPGTVTFGGDLRMVEALPVPASENEARELMARAELQYRQAVAYLGTLDRGDGVLDEREVLRTRLAALDEVGAVTRQALNAAPHDPIINQYYLATLGARTATIQQMDQMTPTVLVGGY